MTGAPEPDPYDAGLRDGYAIGAEERRALEGEVAALRAELARRDIDEHHG